mmetsp:Transcript_24176/g.91239  ORF Transcript_24176/g.91239 Transcript_24176/m.91239 type:complete len:220 (-) Transcript_24176:730-1389(-)
MAASSHCSASAASAATPARAHCTATAREAAESAASNGGSPVQVRNALAGSASNGAGMPSSSMRATRIMAARLPMVAARWNHRKARILLGARQPSGKGTASSPRQTLAAASAAGGKCSAAVARWKPTADASVSGKCMSRPLAWQSAKSKCVAPNTRRSDSALLLASATLAAAPVADSEPLCAGDAPSPAAWWLADGTASKEVPSPRSGSEKTMPPEAALR